jgi:curli biogenesis system outer membrane secretion channel CsgG
MSKRKRLAIAFVTIFTFLFVNVQVGISANTVFNCEKAYKQFRKGERGANKVVKECRKLADKGEPKAQLALGSMYMHTKNPNPNLELSIQNLQACSSQTKDKATQLKCQDKLELALAKQPDNDSVPPDEATNRANTVARTEPSPPPRTKGPKKRLAVLDFDNKVVNRWWDRSANIEERLTEMVITELVNTEMFIIVEREAIQKVIREQDFGHSGRVREGTEAKIGNILGAQVLVKGAVTEFSQKDSGGGGGIKLKGIALGGKSSTGHVAIDIRLIDSATSQILQSHRAEGKIKDKGIIAAGAMKGVAFGGGSFKKTSLGKATREAVKKAGMYITEKMEDQIWSSKIIKAEAGRVYISGGADMNINNGLSLTVYAIGEELIDVDTGINLGQTITKAGTVRVVQVEKKFSIAEIVEGSEFKRGDLVKIK